MRALIVDDELHSCEVTKTLIEEYCPQIELLGYEQNALLAIKRIAKEKPDVLFLDIEMPEINGIDLLEQLPNPIPAVIYTTAYDQFAIDAIKLGAIDYLLKPIDELELIKAINRVSKKLQENELKRNNDKTPSIEKLSIGTMDGIEWIAISDIIRCQSDSNYTVVYTEKGKITASKTLKEIENQLAEHSFFRIHNSHLVNLNRIKRYIKGVGGSIILENGDEVPVSKSRKVALLQMLNF